jgi:hypothetical protein
VTPVQLANRLGISPEFLALSAQTFEGGAKEYLRAMVTRHGASNVFGRDPSGKGVLTYEAAWELAYSEPFEKRTKVPKNKPPGTYRRKPKTWAK